MQGQFWKNFRRHGRGCRRGNGPRMQTRERAAKHRGALSARGGVDADHLSSALRTSRVPRFSLSQRGPPSAQRPSRRRRALYRGRSRSRRRRALYRGRSRSRPPGDSKTMPVYGARPATPEHAAIGKNKTAGRRLAHSVKSRVWTAGPGPAP